MKINKGTFLGIKGPSGKGKTTLLNIMGLLEDYEGHLSIMGEEIAYKNKKEEKNDVEKHNRLFVSKLCTYR